MSPADLADLRRQNPKQQNSNNCNNLKQPVFLCDIMQFTAFSLRDLRNLRENIHVRGLNQYCTNETPMSPADHADYRRQTPKTTITTKCLSLRNNAVYCIPLRDLRNLRENIHVKVLNQSAQKKPQYSPADLADLRRQNPRTTNNHNLSFSAK